MADPPNRQEYLTRTENNGSLSDMSLQQLWWLLAVFTEPGSSPDQRQAYLQQLRGTTGPGYSWEIRQNGLSMLHEVGALDAGNIRDLIESTEHHSWQYRKFARNLFDAVLVQTEDKEALLEIVRTFPREAYGYVYDKMDTP